MIGQQQTGEGSCRMPQTNEGPETTYLETRAVAHYLWMRTAVQTWLMLSLITLTLAIWAPTEAATQFTWKPFNLPLPDLTYFGITGVDYAGGAMVREYADAYSGQHSWRGNGRFTSIPLQTATAINKAKWGGGRCIDPYTRRHRSFVYLNTAFVPIDVPGCIDVPLQAMNDMPELGGDCVGEDGFNHA